MTDVELEYAIDDLSITYCVAMHFHRDNVDALVDRVSHLERIVHINPSSRGDVMLHMYRIILNRMRSTDQEIDVRNSTFQRIIRALHATFYYDGAKGDVEYNEFIRRVVYQIATNCAESKPREMWIQFVTTHYPYANLTSEGFKYVFDLYDDFGDIVQCATRVRNDILALENRQ